MKTIAVIFGGESVEHDVSILTAIQFMNAMDPEHYAVLPVYVSPDGRWWTGKALRAKTFYPLTPAKEKDLKPIRLPAFGLRNKRPHFMTPKAGVFAKEETIPFDLMVPAIHGTNGEDGTLQGYLEFLGVPFAGCSVLAASATMDKDFTKRAAAGIGIPVLDHLVVAKPGEGKSLSPAALKKDLEAKFGKKPFPVIVKPCHLGSSVGVTRAGSMDDLLAGLLLCFRMDHSAIIEPFVQNLVEYNVAVSKAFGEVRASVVERPLKESEFLAFRDKYLAGDGEGAKQKNPESEGMASLNRVIDPADLAKTKKADIRKWACEIFTALGLAGSVRIDFLGDEKSGKLWLNEINTIPGSFAYYLWQESDPAISFTELTSAIIEEGLAESAVQSRETGTALGGAVIFKDG